VVQPSTQLDDVSIVVEGWSRTEKKPPIYAIEAAQASFDFS
jgi:hypothetical protein